MELFFDALEKCALFQGIDAKDLPAILGCLSRVTRQYAKGQILHMAGEPAFGVGVVLSGSVHVFREDLFGNREILSEFGPGDLFGESVAFVNADHLPVSILAAAPCAALYLDSARILSPCALGCGLHSRLIQNMISILSLKNVLLNEKLQILAHRTTREKLLTYLQTQAQKTGAAEFAIPFSRQELADYLCVERSALSREMSALRDEGLIRFNKNHFELPLRAHGAMWPGWGRRNE